MDLATAPLSLNVIEPGAAQQLNIDFKIEQDKYQLRVTDAASKPLLNPIWAHTEVSQEIGEGAAYSGLAGSGDFTNGKASGELFGEPFDARYPLHVRGWIAAPDHVTTVFERDIAALYPQGKNGRQANAAPKAVYRSIVKAQDEASFHIYHPTNLPADTQLKRVTITPPESMGAQWIEVTQFYKLTDGTLKLRQFISKPMTDQGIWGIAYQASKPERVRVHSADAYVIQDKTQWILDWTQDDFGFELWAPVKTFSLAQVIALAESVK